MLLVGALLQAQEWKTEVKALGGINLGQAQTGTGFADGGYTAGVEVARRVGGPLLITGDYIHNDLGQDNAFFCFTPCAKTSASLHELLGGVRLEANADGRVSPYLSFSAGLAHISVTGPDFVSTVGGSTASSTILTTGSNRFAIAPGAGVDFKIVRHLAMGLDLRYLRLTDKGWYARAALGVGFRF